MGGGVSPNEKVRSSVPQLKKKKKKNGTEELFVM